MPAVATALSLNHLDIFDVLMSGEPFNNPITSRFKLERRYNDAHPEGWRHFEYGKPVGCVDRRPTRGTRHTNAVADNAKGAMMNERA